MAGYSIRTYNNRDYYAVRELFSRGMLGDIPATTFYVLKLPQVYCLILASFFIFQWLLASYFLSLVGLGILLVTGQCFLISTFYEFVNKRLSRDLLDIEESYIKKSDACFWVAECGGQVVGIVGAQPAPNSNSTIILRRLSVAKDQRRRGIAKALCMTVFDFARQRGYQHVTLDSSTIKVAAHRLYQRLGFRVTNVRTSRGRLAKFANVSVVYYSCDV